MVYTRPIKDSGENQGRKRCSKKCLDTPRQITVRVIIPATRGIPRYLGNGQHREDAVERATYDEDGNRYLAVLHVYRGVGFATDHVNA